MASKATQEQVTLESAQAELAEAEARVARARQIAEAQAQAAESRRTAAQREFDLQTIADYDDAALEAEIAAANKALREAVLADPVYQAVIKAYQARLTKSHRHSEAVSARRRLGHEDFTGPLRTDGGSIAVSPVDVAKDIQRIVDAEGAARAADLADAHDQARIDVGNEAAARQVT